MFTTDDRNGTLIPAAPFRDKVSNQYFVRRMMYVFVMDDLPRIFRVVKDKGTFYF